MWWRTRGLREAIDRAATPRAILFVGWSLFVVYGFPGYMSYDSVWQLEQARHIEPLNEWHPPLMAYLWRFVDAAIAGPFPMLVIQSTAFLLGLSALLRQVMSNRAAAIVAVVVLIAPQNIVVMGVIWKDSLMAGLLLASIAMLLSPARHRRVAGYVLVFLATGVRYNAPAATLPIVVALFAWHTTMPRWRRYLIAIALWLGITAAAFVVNDLLVEKYTYPWQNGAAPVDIVGTIRFSPLLDNDQLLRDTEGVPWIHTDNIRGRVRAMYSPLVQFLDVTQGPDALMAPPTTEAQRSALAAAWRTLVFSHPVGFLRHRLGLFRAEIESHTGGLGGIWTGFANADWGEDILHHRATHSSVQSAWIRHVIRYDGRYGCRVWVYLAIALALLPMCRRQRLAFVLLASGILHELALFWVAPAIDYRYSHWMVIATIAGAVVLFARRLNPASPQELVSGGGLR